MEALIRDLFLYHRFTLYYFIEILLVLLGNHLEHKHFQGKCPRKVTLPSTLLSLLFASLLMIAYSKTDIRIADTAGAMQLLGIMLKEYSAILVSTVLIYLLAFAVMGRDAVLIRLKRSIYDRRMKLLLLALLLFEVFCSLGSTGDIIEGTWGGAWYALDYSLGFGSRLLVGSVLKLLFPGFLTGSMIRIVLIAVMFALAFLSYFLFAKLLSTMDEDRRETLYYFVLLFLITYGNLYYVGQMVVRFEVFGFLFLLLAVVCMVLVKVDWIKYLLITVFSCLIVMSHQGNFFLDYPAIVILMFMSCYDDNRLHFDKRRTVFAGVSVGITAVLFLYMQFFGTKVITMDFSALQDLIKQRTDILYSPEALRFEYYSTLRETYETLNKPQFLLNSFEMDLPLIHLVLQSLLLSPVLLIWFDFWKSGWRFYASVLQKKQYIPICRFFANPILYVILCFCMVIPEFVLNVDWIRWIRPIFTVQFLSMFGMIYLRKEWALAYLEQKKQQIEQHRVLSYMLLVYLGVFSGFFGRAGFMESKLFMTIVDQLMQLFL